MKKKIFAFLLSFLFIWIFSVGIINAEEKEVLIDKKKLSSVVQVHNISVNKKHFVVNNFDKDSLSPLVFMATWLFDVDSFINCPSGRPNSIHVDLYNPDITKKPIRINIMLTFMIWLKGPYKGRSGPVLLLYSYNLDEIDYMFILKDGKYKRVKGLNQIKI